MEISVETHEYIDAVRQLTIDAFSASELGHNGEAELIEALRNQCSDLLSLVAIDGNQIVGHILFSPVTIGTAESSLAGMGLAPMSVLPRLQGRGVGSMLVNEGLRRLDASTSSFTLVAGHVDYYPRFGFVPAGALSVTHGFAGMPQDILFIRPFADMDTSVLYGGRARFHTSFGPQDCQ